MEWTTCGLVFLTWWIGPVLWAEEEPGEPRVANVIVAGNRKIPTEKVLCYIATKPGDLLSNAELEKDVQRLAASKLFRDIGPVRTKRLLDGRFNVFFEVAEHRNMVREVLYRNAQNLRLAELTEVTKIQCGMPLDPESNRIACVELAEYLRLNGHPFAEVSLNEGRNETDERVVFNIQAGPHANIYNVGFDGYGDWTTSDELAGVIETRQRLVRSWGDYLYPETISRDVELLTRHFRAHGFLDAKVAYELNWHDDFRYVDLTFQIAEGTRYRIADCIIDVPPELPAGELKRQIHVKKGELYAEDAIRADRQRLADWGGKKGKRLDVKSTYVPAGPGRVRVVFSFSDAPVDRVGEIFIVGNTVTKDSVIRKQVSLYPGQIFDYTQLPIIEKRLRELGIFAVETDTGTHPTVEVLDSPGQAKDILIRVQETRTGSLMLGAGLSLDVGPIFTVVLEERNFDSARWPTSASDFFDGTAFRGAGQHFRIEYQGGLWMSRWFVDSWSAGDAKK